MSTFMKVIAVGNVGSDPETKHFEGGGQLSNLSIATSERYTDKQGQKQEVTEWSRVSFNGKLSEIVDKYVKKGDKILVEGKLRTRKWTDGQGIDRYTTEIVARNMTMLTPKGQSQQQPTSAVDNYNNQQAHPASGPAPEDDLLF